MPDRKMFISKNQYVDDVYFIGDGIFTIEVKRDRVEKEKEFISRAIEWWENRKTHHDLIESATKDDKVGYEPVELDVKTTKEGHMVNYVL